MKRGDDALHKNVEYRCARQRLSSLVKSIAAEIPNEMDEYQKMLSLHIHRGEIVACVLITVNARGKSMAAAYSVPDTITIF